MEIEICVNGETRRLEAAPDTPLLDVLREGLGLCAAKLGCGLEQCGACTVLVDGDPVYACTARFAELEGRGVETLEGLERADGLLHPLQQAFLAHNAAQCGFCTAGMIMRAKALLDRERAPTRERICAALDPQLCRCGAHPRILRAVETAARALEAQPS